MSLRVQPFVLLAALSAFVCLDTTPASAQRLGADEKEIASYRLTMPVVKKVAAVTQRMAEEAANEPRVKELTKIKAEIKALNAKDELTDAESARLEKLQERAEALEDEIDRESPASSGNSQTLSDMEARIKKFPPAVQALAREGITAREYSVCLLALMQAMMVEGFSQGKADLKNLPPGVNPENVKFVRENKAELEALQAMMAGQKK